MGFMNLVIRIMGDNSNFKKSVNESSQSIEGFGAKMAGFAGKFLTGSAILGVTKSIADFASKIQDAADRAEVSTDSIQTWMEAAKRGGQDMNTVSTAFDKVRDAMAKVSEGGKEGAKMAEDFERMGVSLAMVESGNAEDVFNALLEKMAAGSLTVEQFASGLDIMGKGFGKLIPMAKELENVSDMMKLSADDIALWDQMGDSVGTLMTQLKVAGGKVGVGLAALPFALASIVTGDESYLQGFGADSKQRQEAMEAGRKAQIEAVKKLAAEKKKEADAEEAIDVAAKAHMATMDRVQEMEDKAAALSEKARVTGLSKDERRNELMAKRQKLLEYFAYINENPERAKARSLDPALAEIDAKGKLELAETEDELARLNKEKPKTKIYANADADALAKIGGFIGGQRDPLIDIQQRQLNYLDIIARNTAKGDSKVGGRNINSYF